MKYISVLVDDEEIVYKKVTAIKIKKDSISFNAKEKDGVKGKYKVYCDKNNSIAVDFVF